MRKAAAVPVLALCLLVLGAVSPAGVYAAPGSSGSPGAAASPVAGAASGIESQWQSSGKSFPAGAAFKKPQAWAAGQYVVMGSTVNGKRQNVTRTLIVRKEGDGWVMETSNIDAKGAQMLTQIVLAGYDQAVASADPGKLSVVKMTNKDKAGKVTVMEKEELAAFGDMMKQNFQRMFAGNLVFADGGPISVPAGSFAGTSSAQTTLSMFGKKVEQQSWYNSAVPVNGIVKSVSKDGKTVNELLAFGFDGKARLN